MSQPELLKRVVETLKGNGAAYMVIGSIASEFAG
jgi:hypothetical protein